MKVAGKIIDSFTRCEHYHSELDIIAIKFPCCNTYYPCFDCHRETAGHDAVQWKKNEFDAKAVLCGNCKQELTVNEYVQSDNQCPFCKASFNPGCANHYELYFDI
jgi:uncharacterized CHY-type Zn-finger protein